MELASTHLTYIPIAIRAGRIASAFEKALSIQGRPLFEATLALLASPLFLPKRRRAAAPK